MTDDLLTALANVDKALRRHGEDAVLRHLRAAVAADLGVTMRSVPTAGVDFGAGLVMRPEQGGVRVEVDGELRIYVAAEELARLAGLAALKRDNASVFAPSVRAEGTDA